MNVLSCMIHQQFRDYLYNPCPRGISLFENLAMGGHVNGSVALESIFAPPEGSDSLQMKGSPC